MTRVFAHRGLSGSYPENTMLAFEKALETGCDGMELDVQLTSDGELVVMHDETVDRTTGAAGRVRDLSLEELRRLDASAGFTGAFGRNAVPTLDEYFDLVDSAAIVTNIELKNGIYPYPGIERMVADAVKSRGLEDRIILSSFNHQSILECRRLAPKIETAFILSCWLIGAGAYCRANGGDYVNPRHVFLTPDNVAELRNSGTRAQAWTVDDPAEAVRLAALGVDSIITNKPDTILAALRP